MLSHLGRKWRNRCPKEHESIVSNGLSKKFFILQEKGPLKFILKDELGLKFQVLLGETHHCTCQTKHGPSLCEHVVWSLYRKLHIPSTSPLLFQTGLLERELD
ncbi:E3 ubiquitin-protein ligase Zswim2, partial [Coelomomyces lativittatus]